MEKIIKFENGLRLVMNQNLGMYSVTTGLWVESGCSFETEENSGISHFIEHNLFKGTERRTSFEISDCIDRIGGQMNAFTSKEATCYYVKCTDEYFGLSLDLLADMLLNSKFDDVEIEKEKGVILEEIAMVEDTPDDICMELLSKAIFKDGALGKNILGPAENIKKFGKKDIKEFMDLAYNPKNIVISIAGNFNMDNAEKLVKEYFIDKMPNTGEKLVDYALKEITSGYNSKVKDIEQCHIAFAFPSINYSDKRIYEYSILNNILGGGMSSRLFQSIREDKGLAYTVFSFNSVYKNEGTLVVYAGVNQKNVQMATEAIRDEIKKLAKNGITKDEFERGKAQTIGSFMFAQENTASLMSIYGKSMLLNDTLYDIQEKVENMRAITYEDVNALAKTAYDFTKVSGSQVGRDVSCNILDVMKS